MHPLARLDHQHVWHPFTQMRDWLRQEPILIESGNGAVLRDVHGREYLDANSSIWTNLHGHRHPKLNRALHRQLETISHSSALGLANGPAARLAARLVQVARSGAPGMSPPSAASRARQLSRVFFSDNGSTAVEVALKLAHQYAQRVRGIRRPKFLSLGGAYHGDTVGAVSVGHIELFHRAYSSLLFNSDQLMAPYCYRCPFNRAAPERQDARHYRRCAWECIRQAEAVFQRRKRSAPYAAMLIEPLLQGAAGMIPQPDGWLKRVTTLARRHGTLVIADEVMTAFGRVTASPPPESNSPSLPTEPLFACQSVGVTPDLLCLAKGLTGGYLPMAATLTTEAVFGAFLGEYEEFKTFFHGHSYTGNQLGAASALASLEVLQSRSSQRARARLQRAMAEDLQALWHLPQVGDIRQVGLVAGVELVRDWRTRAPFALRERAGHRVCEAMAQRGVLTRPIGNVVVLMPTYATTRAQARKIVEVLGDAIESVLGRRARQRH